MTLNAAYGAKPPHQPSGLQARVSPLSKIPQRSFEFAALRKDGSLIIGQDSAPAIHLFENAFSAFARGTLITTPTGDVAVEDLQPGDMISTADGGAQKLVWVGSSNFVPADAGRRLPLCRIMPDAFGRSRPQNYLTLGPAARILHTPHEMRAETGEKRMLVSLNSFVDGVNVIEVVPPTPIRLFHLCLEQHAVMLASGIEIESYHPGANATLSVSEALRSRFLSMFPHIDRISDFGPVACPRAPEPTESAQMGLFTA